jgi:hypothetical protein
MGYAQGSIINMQMAVTPLMTRNGADPHEMAAKRDPHVFTG